jgi:hypothetical protein
MAFNYDDDTIADADVVSAVAAQMSNTPAKPLSDLERAELDNFIAESRERDRQQRAEYDRQRTEAEAAQRAEASRVAETIRAEASAKLREQLAERERRLNRDRTLTGLLNHAVDQQQFRQQVLRSQANAASRARLKSLLNPPAPPEPTVVVVQPEDDGSADLGSPNFDVDKWSKKPRSWW